MKAKRGEGSIFKRGGVYWIKYYRNGRPVRESTNVKRDVVAYVNLRQPPSSAGS